MGALSFRMSRSGVLGVVSEHGRKGGSHAQTRYLPWSAETRRTRSCAPAQRSLRDDSRSQLPSKARGDYCEGGEGVLETRPAPEVDVPSSSSITACIHSRAIWSNCSRSADGVFGCSAS